jgi:hypothetical protein
MKNLNCSLEIDQYQSLSKTEQVRLDSDSA